MQAAGRIMTRGMSRSFGFGLGFGFVDGGLLEVFL